MSAPTSTAAPAAARRARPAGPLAEDLAVVSVLWRRDLVRFFREKSRVVGALVQPLLFWLVIGSGMSSTFALPGRAAGIGYLEYFFPGVVVMVVLFTAIFATMSVIEDRARGFLQGVLAAPSSRTAIVLGKCLGASSVAMIQAFAFLLLAPVTGFPLGGIDWPLVLATLALCSIALTATGFAVAWWLDSTQGYHVVMSLLLLPLWILSGAMFPAPGVRWIQIVMRFDPVAYAVAALRRGLYGGRLPDGAGLAAIAAPGVDLLVLAGFALVAVMVAARVCQRGARS
jgi:daunorubicin resistance ABC transporter membrane protein